MKFLFLISCVLWLVPLTGQDNIALVGSKEGSSIELDLGEIESYKETKFKLHDRLIIVEAELNGKIGNYIFDTGSPNLLINQKVENSSSLIGGVAKNCEAEVIDVQEFKWAGISSKSIQAVAFDMTNLEKTFGAKIDGLIGQGLFNQYEILIDFSNQYIRLFKPKKSKFHKKNKYQQKINFSFENHIPVIMVKIDGKKYRFGIDTGAEVNVLNKELKEELELSLFSNWDEGKVYGVDGISEKIESANLDLFLIKKSKVENQKFMFMDFTNLKDEFDMELDGILGYPFLSRNVISINYQKKKIYIW